MITEERWEAAQTAEAANWEKTACSCSRSLHELEVHSWRMLQWWSLEPYMDGAFVWRMRRNGYVQRPLNALAWWPTRKLRLDASCMTAPVIEGFIAKFNRLRPPLLQGYVGAVDHLASYIERNGCRVHAPKAVWTTASVLPPIVRQRIERVFQSPVYDEYGCSEIRGF